MNSSIIPSRRICWIPSNETNRGEAVASLQQRMAEYYRQPRNYYGDIREGTTLWQRRDGLAHEAILSVLTKQAQILEVGCGEAAILRTGRVVQSRYTGCDFSKELLEGNARHYPQAKFAPLLQPDQLPFADGSFDAVFSVFVIEHSARPATFLQECVRVVRPGGHFLLLCPDFLGAGWMASQRVGFTKGTGREKLRKGRWWDAMVTGFDQRIRVPAHAWRCRQIARRRPQFYVNLVPTCFTDPFTPDVDAVYVTFADEMKQHLAKEIQFAPFSDELRRHLQLNRLILLQGTRRAG